MEIKRHVSFTQIHVSSGLFLSDRGIDCPITSFLNEKDEHEGECDRHIMLCSSKSKTMFEILPQPSFIFIFIPFTSTSPLHSHFFSILQPTNFLLSLKKTHLFSYLQFSMASDQDISELSSQLARIIRIANMSLRRRFRENLNHDSENSHPESILLLNPFTQGMMVIDGVSSLESLFRDLAAGSTKSGQPPATKDSIEGLPSVEIGESGEEGECVVCLEEFEIGGVVKEMPCKHRFHCNCIEKWLGIHGSCPVCRFEMPFDEAKKSDEEEEEGERRSGEVWVSFSFNRGSNRGTQEDQSQNSAAESIDSTSSPRSDADVETSS